MAFEEICSVDGCGKKCKARGLCSTHYNNSRDTGFPPMSDSKRGLTKKWILDHVAHQGTECLIWPFARLKQNGYPVASCDGRHQIASRVMCEEAHGPPPEEWYEAAHSCGNGRGGCVNPNHIRWSTPSDNRHEKTKHGTMRRGTKCHNARFTEDEIREIRELDKSMRRIRIAEKFNVDSSLISRIMNGTHWAWLDSQEAVKPRKSYSKYANQKRSGYENK